MFFCVSKFDNIFWRVRVFDCLEKNGSSFDFVPKEFGVLKFDNTVCGIPSGHLTVLKEISSVSECLDPLLMTL